MIRQPRQSIPPESGEDYMRRAQEAEPYDYNMLVLPETLGGKVPDPNPPRAKRQKPQKVDR